MAIIFDKNGKLIREKIKYKPKLTDIEKDIIQNVNDKFNINTEKETRTYFCKVHNRFHKHLYKNEPSKTYIKCLESGNILKFKDDYTISELFQMNFREKWNQEKADYYKKV